MQTVTRDQEIASEILRQLGGQNRITVMTGAKNFCAVKNGVKFFIGAKVITITLNSLDYYDVEFGTIRKCVYKVKEKVANVDCENLKKCIEQLTGMYLSL